MKVQTLTKSALILLSAGALAGAFAAEGDAYTWPTYSSKLKRLEGKSRRSGVKSMRGRPTRED